MKPTILALLILCTGCASRHAYMRQPKALGLPHYQCDAANDCELVRDWKPSQLTPTGCVLHTIVTGGHIAWECRKPKNGKTPSGGTWIWKEIR
jgi:hypothetical protein